MQATKRGRSSPLIAIGMSILCVLLGASQRTANPLEEARSRLAAGDFRQSEIIVRDYIKDNPSSAEARFLLGDILFREQRARESLAEFTAGAQLREPGPDELRTVASDYVLLGDYADADKWFSEVTSKMPNDPEAWYLLGRTKYNENRFAEAISGFGHVLALRPRNVQAEDNLGLSQQGLGHSDDAKAAFQKAIEWQGDAPVDAQPFLNLGILLADQGDFRQAAEYLVRATALAPKNPKIHEELARAVQAHGDLDQAQTELETAVKLAPNAAGLHFKLGQIYRRRGLNQRAQQEFAICERLNATHSSTEVPNPFSPARPERQ